MIPPQVIDKIFDVAPIEEVVGEYVTLKRAGANYKGLCPFHDDKSPSMSVSPSKGIFKCFSCGQGGNIFQFIMEHEGLSYPLAIKHLADRYNIPIEEEDIDVDELQEEARIKEGVYVCLEFAKKHFYERLNDSQDGKVVYKPYLTERGINQQTIDKFQIGLSGTEKSHLLNEGLKNGYTVQQLFDAGLVKKINEDQGIIESNLRDTFIERIVFPIYNVSGKVLGFGGRIIKKDTKAPKYLNSPETIVYEKRKQLYGLSISKNQIRKSDQVFLVEGYMDVVSLNQSGVENVVAASGTAFTEEQARLLKRFTHNITMLFDGDVAGVNASLKHISTLLEAGLNVRVALFPEGEDPDSFIQKRGTAEFQSYVSEKAQNFIELISEIKLGENKHDPINKAEAARAIAENIASIPDPLKRAAFINETATSLEIPERILIDEVNKFKLDNRKQKERETRREARQEERNIADGPPPGFDYVPDFTEFKSPEALNVDKVNYQELELLRNLILYADREFDEEQNVAQFIFKELEEDEIWPMDDEYSLIFKEALEYLTEDNVLNELYFIRNPKTSKIAADALSVKYSLSKGWEENFEKIVKTDEDNYKRQVVENLNYVKLKHIDILMTENQEGLKTAETEEDISIYQNVHTNLQEIRKKITDQIGTVILR
ncbi:DNA primase [Bacteroidia bacterium]|nr:DNA primase [Bacteroidia bacterium]MDB9881918.1 DNA primase [Bacteroidia bacterium]MDC1394891.1 DNA primase [Bacteroidia bacterium]